MNIRQEIHDLWASRTKFGKEPVRLHHRIRLSRNLLNFPFSQNASIDQRFEILKELRSALNETIDFQNKWLEIPWNSCNPNERSLLTSLYFLENPCDETILWIHEKKHIQIIAHDRDHLRLQYLSNQLSLKKLWKAIDKLDTQLEAQLNYSFDPSLGYYTCASEQLGTGILAEVLLHIPGLCFLRKLSCLEEAANEMQLHFKPFQLVNDKILGHLFSLSNAFGRGCNEKDLCEHLETISQKIIDNELKVRKSIEIKNVSFLKDSISRSFGLLRNCYEISYEEAMNLLSVILMALDMDIISGIKRNNLTSLWQSISPINLREFYKKDFLDSEENTVRANIVRAFFSKLPNVSIFKAKEGTHV